LARGESTTGQRSIERVGEPRGVLGGVEGKKQGEKWSKVRRVRQGMDTKDCTALERRRQVEGEKLVKGIPHKMRRGK